MTLPFALPDWFPGWLFLALLIPALLWFLAFLMVPFNVFGVKARLEALEAALDELNEEFRVSQMRASGVVAPTTRSTELYDDVPQFNQLKRTRMEEPVAAPPPIPARPPIPTPAPSSFAARESLTPRERPAAMPPRPRRTEPRLD